MNKRSIAGGIIRRLVGLESRRLFWFAMTIIDYNRF